MADNKKHHFVSRFYLKNFGSNDGRSINIFNIKNSTIISSGQLKGQCYRNYLYGKDGKIEKCLSIIESHAAKVIRGIIDARHLPRPLTEQHFVLLSAVLIQWGRTVAAGAQLNELMDQFYHNALKEFYSHNTSDHGIPKAELDELTLGYEEPERASLSLSAQMVPVALDLAYKVLENRTSVEFFTSDNPVLLYNQFAHGRAPGSTTGFQAKGLQIFLPLSNNYLLVFYDAGIYKIGDRKQLYVPIAENDARTLNLMQSINSYDNIYFCSEFMANEVKSTVGRAQPKRQKSQSGFRIADQSPTSELLHFYRNDIKHRCKFGFNKMRAGMSMPFNDHVPPRNSSNIERYDAFMKELHAGRADFYDLPKFFDFIRSH